MPPQHGPAAGGSPRAPLSSGILGFKGGTKFWGSSLRLPLPPPRAAGGGRRGQGHPRPGIRGDNKEERPLHGHHGAGGLGPELGESPGAAGSRGEGGQRGEGRCGTGRGTAV